MKSRLVPLPEGLERNAWSYFALFAAVIVGLILEPPRIGPSTLHLTAPLATFR